MVCIEGCSLSRCTAYPSRRIANRSLRRSSQVVVVAAAAVAMVAAAAMAAAAATAEVPSLRAP